MTDVLSGGMGKGRGAVGGGSWEKARRLVLSPAVRCPRRPQLPEQRLHQSTGLVLKLLICVTSKNGSCFQFDTRTEEIGIEEMPHRDSHRHWILFLADGSHRSSHRRVPQMPISSGRTLRMHLRPSQEIRHPVTSPSNTCTDILTLLLSGGCSEKTMRKQ